MTQEQIALFDTTLRDGQQCPGAGMSFERNLEYARLAAQLGIDILEAGFPSASSTDFEIVHTITEELATDENHHTTIAGLCQLRSEQIDTTIAALEPAISRGRARLHTYVPVDPLLMQASLGSLAEDHSTLLKRTSDYISRAAEAGLEVQFSPEGYSRQGENFDFVTDLLRAAVEAGARILNCPDTIGSACYIQGDNYFVAQMNRHAAILREEYPELSLTWSVHCHNDFGLAVANSLHGVFDGPARQIEGCINGVGERAGNAALEQCIMAIRSFSSSPSEKECSKFFTNANTKYLQGISNFVSRHMLPRQPHWPISGENAARHSSGGHTNAILNNIHVYQPFDPAETGSKVSLLFGPLSGSNHAQSLIEEAGYSCPDEEKAEITQFIKDRYADRRKGITDAELLTAYRAYRQPISITSFDYSRNAKNSEVHLEGQFFDHEGPLSESYEGEDSALAALKAAIDRRFPGYQIASHQSQSEGEGIAATSNSKIVLTGGDGNEYVGRGSDRDIEISAMKALIDATNTAYVEHYFRRGGES
ncbi:2-isopropylmalate synthase [bacterium]|nr:2-isopropylmalate synthase [bacterium]